MNGMSEVWGSWSRGSRTGFVAGVMIILLTAGAAIWWALHTNYAVLFKELQPQDAATVVSELKRLKIDHRIADGGATVLVSENTVAGTRLELMGSNPKFSGGVGLELFDQSDFGMTEFAQRINYQRALQGEITRTISSLSEVKSARVHLVLPENGLFAQKKEPARASITLFMKDNAAVTANQIMGIQRLVAASVPGLDSDHVTVASQDGAILSAPVVEGSSGEMLSGHFEKKREVESYLKQKVVDLLSRDFGEESYVVSVNVALNFDQVRITREDVVPGSNFGVVRKKENKASNGMAPVQKGESSVVEYEYQLGREVNQTVIAPGEIKQINVGVLLPADVTETQIHKVRDLVATVLALTEERGDQIAVHRMQRIGTLAERQSGLGATTSPFPSETPDTDPGLISPLAEPSKGVVAKLREFSIPPSWRADLPTLFRGNGMIVVGIALAFSASVILMLLLRSRPQPEPGLSIAEREKVLADVRQWLRQPARADGNPS